MVSKYDFRGCFMSYSTVKALFTAICDAIREKDGTGATIYHQDIPARIQAIEMGVSWDDVLSRSKSTRKSVVANSASQVPQYQFYYDKGIRDFSSTSVKTIGNQAFYETRYLKNLNCPAVTSIGADAFCYAGLSNYGLNATLTALTTIEARAFGNALILSFDAPNVTTIGNFAFDTCYLLTTLDTKATSIGSNAFSCASITTLILRSDNVCTLATNGLSNSHITDIYVKDELVETYKTATNWSEFASMIKGISEIPTT